MTEKIETTCASCGKMLIVPAAAANKKALCKACREKTQFEVTIAPEAKDNVTPDTVTLGKSLAATKLIKDILKVEPSVDLDHMPGKSFDSDSNLKPEDSGQSIRDIISRAKKDTKYIVDKIIGQGGMGAVLGTIDQDIRRKVAMKVMLPENRSDTLKIRRFLEEAQVTGQLEHPNIVPVHEIGIDENARIYFTMKLVQGENLETIIKRCATGNSEYLHKYCLGTLLQLFMKVVDGMSYAHAKGVLHRDLKPENIMVGSFGEVLIMDWGIFKIFGQETTLSEGNTTDIKDSSRKTMTIEGRIMGTPAYLSPEQACGHISELDQRSDVFALGGILYKILTFCNPYEGPTIEKSLEQAQNGDLVPPEVRTPNKNIPPELAAICKKAMAYEKENRYADATEINSDLQLYLDGKSVSAKKDSLVTKTGKWIARNKIASAGIAAAIICLIIGMIAATMYQDKLRQEKVASLLEKADSYVNLENFESAEETYYAVIGLDSGNPAARGGITRVSGKALSAKNKRLAKETLEKAEVFYENEAYQNAYDAYVATLALDPESPRARIKIQASAVMAEKQKTQAMVGPIIDQARAMRIEMEDIQSRSQRLHTDIETMQKEIKGFEGRKTKQPLWEAEKKLSAVTIQGLKNESRMISKYLMALSFDGTNPEARKGLSQIYYDRYTTGEHKNDPQQMAFYRSLVLTFDDGHFRTLLEQTGSLTITSRPMADAFYLHRIVEGADRRLVPAVFDPSAPLPPGDMDPNVETKTEMMVMTSLQDALTFSDTNHLDTINHVQLPAGSYLVTLKKNGYLDTRIPIRIKRGAIEQITDIGLFKRNDLPDGFIYIPKGPSLIGGDDAAPYSLASTVRDIPGFFISRYEVTTEEYLAFVNDMEKRIPGSAFKYLPRKSSKSGHYWKKSGTQYKNNFPAAWPVLGISWNDARAYCKWMTHRHKKKGWMFRLPEEWEWEKAARGADSRYFPWGNHFDFTFCSMANSKSKKRNGPDPVGSFGPDESIYGVMDMAGNVSEWCNTYYDQINNIRINRGAAWSYAEADYARCAARNGHNPSDVADFRGFRMVVSLP